MEVRAGAFSDADVDRYWAAMCMPGVARAALSYYRAAFRSPAWTEYPITQQTLVLWGERDPALSAGRLLAGLERYAPKAHVVRFANAGHWLHHDLPEVVSRHSVDFLSGLDLIPTNS
jgi:pimeloyl-ACP methyl ester carboxylesterase